MSGPLFRRVLGEAFDTLPPQVLALHSVDRRALWRGEATITRGRHVVARLCARIAGLPPAGEGTPTSVEFHVHEGGETWRRDFGGARMVSRFRARDGRLRERLGPMEFVFALEARDGQILWKAIRVRVLGVLPLPAAWFSRVHCREREVAGRYEFLVDAALPWVGPLIRYEGWLTHE